MEREEILEYIKLALSEVSGAPIKHLSDEMCLISDFDLESIDVVDFIFQFERLSNCQLNLATLAKMSQMQNKIFNDFSIKDIVDHALAVSQKQI